MRRRDFLAGAAGTTAALLAHDLPASAAPRPNIVQVIIDDLNNWPGYVGGPAKTPNLDSFAQGSTVYSEAHVPVSMCMPARASTLWSRSPGKTGFIGLHDQYLGPNCEPCYGDFRGRRENMFDRLNSSGYLNFGAGKIAHAPNDNEFAQYRDIYPDMKLYRAFMKEQTSYWKVKGHLAGAEMPGKPMHPDAKARSWCVRKIRYLQYMARKPWMVTCGFYSPHIPFSIPRRFYDMYSDDEVTRATTTTKAARQDLEDVPDAARDLYNLQVFTFNNKKKIVHGYLAAISFIDEQFGKLMREVSNDTAVVVWSDNGWALGEKLKWHKSALWRNATNVPLMVRGPGFSPGRYRKPVSLLDLAPTICRWAGASTSGMDGKPLQERRVRPVKCWWEDGRAVYRGKYHLIRYADGSEELYDIVADPEEEMNLLTGPTRASYLSVAASMRKALPK